MSTKYAQNMEDALARAEARLAAPRMSEEQLAERLAEKAAGDPVAVVEAQDLARARTANRKSAEKWAGVRAEQAAEAATVSEEIARTGRLFRVDLPQEDRLCRMVTEEDIAKATVACERAYPEARGVRIQVIDFGNGMEVVWDPIMPQVPRFERIRRITGYLVGTLDRFNNGKRSEEHDRVKHSCSCCG